MKNLKKSQENLKNLNFKQERFKQERFLLNREDYLNTEKIIRSHAHEIADIVWVNPTDNIRILPKSLAEDFKAGKIVSDEVKYIKD